MEGRIETKCWASKSKFGVNSLSRPEAPPLRCNASYPSPLTTTSQWRLLAGSKQKIAYLGLRSKTRPEPPKWVGSGEMKKRRNPHVIECKAEGMERGAGEKSSSRSSAGPERLKLVVLMACAMCLCNADRVVMSVAVVPLAAKNGWSSSFLGIVQSSFLWGYILSSAAGGALVDKYGGKRVLGWGVALWSFGTFLTPMAANHSTVALLVVRVFFGLAEGVALPSMTTLSSKWFPSHMRSSAVAISMAGFHMGNVAGFLLTPVMMTSLNLAAPFLLFSSLGIFWVMWWTVTTDPGHHNSELQQISPATTTLRHLLSKRPTWAIIFANAINNWGYFVLFSWMPVYFKTVFNVNLKQAAWFSAVPWWTKAVSGYIAGVLADRMIRAGCSFTLVRKIMQTIGFIGPGIALLCLNYAKSPIAASICITSALSLSSFSQAGFLVNINDIAPQCAGFLHGIANSAGTFAAIISTIGTGYFVQWLGSFQAFLMLTSALYFIAAVIWNLYSTGDRVF